MPSLRVKRGTRAQLDSAAGSSGLNEGEIYLITDENRLAVGLSATTYEVYSKVSELYDDTALDARVTVNDAKVSNVAHPLVETAVPVGAVFTDTVYDDTTIQGEVDANTAKVGVTNEITTFFQSSQPGGAGVGDLWIDTTGAANRLYRFDGTFWGDVQDSDIALALTNAATAQSTADSHTQAASTITDFDTEVSNNASVVANTAKISATQTNVENALDGSVYDPNEIREDAFHMDNMSEGGVTKIFTATERANVVANTAKVSYTDAAKVAGIEAGADVTDTANVTSAGALMDSELTSIADVKALNQSVVIGSSPNFTTTNFTDATNKRLMTDAQETKLDSVESNADVTDATNVNAAGATMNTDTNVSSNSWVVDEDTMSSDDATKVPTQQSVKAYVDNKEVEVNHGATAGTSRPSADRVVWIGSVDPTNKQLGDRWIQTY